MQMVPFQQASHTGALPRPRDQETDHESFLWSFLVPNSQVCRSKCFVLDFLTLNSTIQNHRVLAAHFEWGCFLAWGLCEWLVVILCVSIELPWQFIWSIFWCHFHWWIFFAWFFDRGCLGWQAPWQGRFFLRRQRGYRTWWCFCGREMRRFWPRFGTD